MRTTFILIFTLCGFFVYSQKTNQNQTASKVPIGISIDPIDPNDPTPIDPIDPIDPVDPGIISEVGQTKGQLSVSLTGGATYNFPISVPPGINGVKPNISIVYNSQSGNSLAGYGWNISGISSITRIPSTKFHDGLNNPINFDSNDRFALDGHRLFAKNGAIYGANGTEYETENFSNIKITSYGVHLNGSNYGPSHFIVEYPDGSKAEYGIAVGSQSKTTWAISSWKNPQGISIYYEYYFDNHNLLVSKIKYGGLINFINEISFIYKDRATISYESGNVGEGLFGTKILSNIEVKGNNTKIRNYEILHFITSSGYEKIVSITEKNGDLTKSFNPVYFTYYETGASLVLHTKPFNLSSPCFTTPNGNYNNTTDFFKAHINGDFDGNGKTDIISFSPYNGINTKVCYKYIGNLDKNQSPVETFNEEVGFFDDIFTTKYLSGDNLNGYKLMANNGWCIIKFNQLTRKVEFKMFSKTVGSNSSTLEYAKEHSFDKYCMEGVSTWEFKKKYYSGDFNGDNITDVIAIESGGGAHGYTVAYESCSGQAFNVNMGKVYFINLDKRVTTGFVNLSGNIGFVGDNQKIITGDTNGDGKTELINFQDGNAYVYSMDSNNNLILVGTSLFPYDIYHSSRVFYPGDFNGDGKLDIVAGNYIYISKGYTFKQILRQSMNIGDLGISFDINNDGKSDIVSEFGIFINKNNGSSFEKKEVSSANGLFGMAQTFIYCSNVETGKMDFGTLPNYANINFYEYTNDLKLETSLKTIQNDINVLNTISYTSLNSESSNYTSISLIEEFPNYDIKTANGLRCMSSN